MTAFVVTLITFMAVVVGVPGCCVVDYRRCSLELRCYPSYVTGVVPGWCCYVTVVVAVVPTVDSPKTLHLLDVVDTALIAVVGCADFAIERSEFTPRSPLELAVGPR